MESIMSCFDLTTVIWQFHPSYYTLRPVRSWLEKESQFHFKGTVERFHPPKIVIKGGRVGIVANNDDRKAFT
jgi:hypothetical protein